MWLWLYKNIKKIIRERHGGLTALGKPWLLYVPFWCPENVLSDQFRWIHSANPGNPQLVFAEPHPDDAARFYHYLLSYGKRVGMAGFEHDYLDYNYLSMCINNTL